MGSISATASCAIASGQSLSAACWIGEKTLVGIKFPAAWDAADITFQISYDGVTWENLCDDTGTEVQKTVTAGQFRELEPSEFKNAVYLKVRSGTSGAAVNQTAARTLTLYKRRYSAR